MEHVERTTDHQSRKLKPLPTDSNGYPLSFDLRD